MDKDVALAIKHWQSYIDSGKSWAKLNIEFEPIRKVELIVGPCSFDGRREQKSATYKYYIGMDEMPHFVVYGHP